MASIKTAGRLTKEIIGINIISNDNNLNITPMLNGPHGIGKSQIVKSAAKAMNGYCYVIEGGSLKEGEITGLPFAQQNADGSSEVRFVKYYAINKIWQLEKFYYEKAKTEGFLNGTIKLEVDAEGNEYLINGKTRTLSKSVIDKIEAGEDNKYKFGEELDGETKMKLLESGEIKPVIIFIDELNRTEMQTMKELMNIILNKCINGYNLPWFVSVVSAVNPCSQNSTYATNELDDAQLDRFLKIRVEAKLDEWIDHELMSRNMNADVVGAIAMDEGIFIHREKSQEDTSEMTPSPRSWEMVGEIYEHLSEVLKSKFFTDEDRKYRDDDLRALIKGKVGETAARELMKLIDDKENHIKPEEIITGKSLKIDSKITAKFSGFKSLSQMVIANNLVNYIAQNIDTFYKGKTSSDAKEKELYMNFKGQLKEFTEMLNPATQIVFVKRFLAMPDGNRLFNKVSPSFSSTVLATITEAKSNIRDLNEQ